MSEEKYTKEQIEYIYNVFGDVHPSAMDIIGRLAKEIENLKAENERLKEMLSPKNIHAAHHKLLRKDLKGVEK